MTIHEVSANDFRENVEREVANVVTNHAVLRVRREGGDFVVLSAEDWRAVEETLYLSTAPGWIESLLKASCEPLEEGTRVEDLDW